MRVFDTNNTTMPKIEKKNRGSRGKVDTLKTQSLTPNLQDLIKSEILLLYNVQIVLCKPGPTKDYKNDMCCFFVKHTTLRIKNIDCLDGIRIMCLNGETALPEEL